MSHLKELLIIRLVFFSQYLQAIGEEEIKNHFEAFKKNNYTCTFSLEFTSVNITADSVEVRLNMTVIATMTGMHSHEHET